MQGICVLYIWAYPGFRFQEESFGLRFVFGVKINVRLWGCG